jgi:hypothetical protein
MPAGLCIHRSAARALSGPMNIRPLHTHFWLRQSAASRTRSCALRICRWLPAACDRSAAAAGTCAGCTRTTYLQVAGISARCTHTRLLHARPAPPGRLGPRPPPVFAPPSVLVVTILSTSHSPSPSRRARARYNLIIISGPFLQQFISRPNRSGGRHELNSRSLSMHIFPAKTPSPGGHD